MSLREIVESIKNQPDGPSFTKIAKIAGISRSTLYKWMDNTVTPSIQGLEKISSEYKVDLATICEDCGIEFRPLANIMHGTLPSLFGGINGHQDSSVEPREQPGICSQEKEQEKMEITRLQSVIDAKDAIIMDQAEAIKSLSLAVMSLAKRNVPEELPIKGVQD